MGRPTKLTPEVQKTITDAIAIGATYQAAAEYAGVAMSTFNLWMTRTGKPYVEFSEAVRASNAKARVMLLAAIQKPAQAGDWRAAAWILERRFSDDYGQKVKQELTGADRGPIKIEAFDYAASIAAIAAGPEPDSDAPGEGENRQHGPALGEDADGG